MKQMGLFGKLKGLFGKLKGLFGKLKAEVKQDIKMGPNLQGEKGDTIASKPKTGGAFGKPGAKLRRGLDPDAVKRAMDKAGM